MRRGFTIIELLVASLLLGMLVTILTMIFNQSSIAWRIGVNSVADLDDARDDMAALREEADNAILLPTAPDRVYRTVGLWNPNGTLRKRACNDPSSGDALQNFEKTVSMIYKPTDADPKPQDFSAVSIGNGTVQNADTYTVNVKSAGPNRKFGDYDDVWSWPDDFD